MTARRMDRETRTIVLDLKREILARQPAGWPPDSLFTFLRGLPPATVGTRFGSELVARILDGAGLATRKGGTRLYDLVVGGGDGLRVEVKTSTEFPTRRFQQVRDPRPGVARERWRYDALVCLGVRPDDLTIWLLPGPQAAELIADGTIGVQHTDSETNWFFPNEDAPTCPFNRFLVTRRELVGAIRRMKPLVGD
ncbi:MAG: hypothetical protein HY907_01970 [Deltaproteobacteria bacterium]|nr:hypothetical protein [Deltaproteobacteria bacterium]